MPAVSIRAGRADDAPDVVALWRDTPDVLASVTDTVDSVCALTSCVTT